MTGIIFGAILFLASAFGTYYVGWVAFGGMEKTGLNIFLALIIAIIGFIGLIVMINSIIKFFKFKKATKGMTPSQKLGYFEKQQAEKDRLKEEESKKEICANCRYYNGFGQCTRHTRQKWVDLDDGGYYKTVNSNVRRVSSCGSFVNKNSEQAKHLDTIERNRKEGHADDFKW